MKYLWFRDTSEEILFIDENIMRARSGLLIILPIFMAFSFFHFNSMFTSQWIIDATTYSSDFIDTDNQGRKIYALEAVKRTYDYTLQTIVLSFAFFDLLCGMSIWSTKFSPLIQLASFFMKNKKPKYTPYSPKRFSWSLGLCMVSLCILFFNPNMIPFVGSVFIPLYGAILLLSLCSLFIWMELAFGYCIGCTIHAFLVKVGIFKDECYECNNIYGT